LRAEQGQLGHVAAVVPARDAADFLPTCLKALRSCDPPPCRIVLVDDGSRDDTAAIARAWGAEVIVNPGPATGPGLARNRAAQLLENDWLLFVDADVAIRPAALQLLCEAVAENGVVAAFGSYDDSPPARGVASRYANLRHHYIHQQSPPYAHTFWAGLGMVQRDAFLEAGSFSSAYGRPSIEDIELGSRLIARGGRIRVVPEAMGTHLKHWSLVQLWRTDIFQRALPWARLIADGRSSDSGLNGSGRERLAAVLANLTIGLLLLSFFWPQLVAASLIGFAGYLYVNRAFFGFLRSRMRPLELPGAVLLHFAYHLYASQAFGWTLVASRIRRSARSMGAGGRRKVARPRL
jgi:glycosyltransferase involved in cell wall biosynthesis